MTKKNKKKILFHSNYSKALTGFGKNAKNVLKYLYNTGKYEIYEACNGFSKSNPSLSKMPWHCYGTLPDSPQRIKELNQDPNLARSAGYGSEMIDNLIKEIKPDIYIGAEDIWAFNQYWERKWWNKINCMIWTTLDSQPILPLAIESASHIKNYYVWASFAEREMSKLGIDHVKTLHGIVDSQNFFKLPKSKKTELRKSNLIDSNTFLIGFVFRNQLRKSVPNLLDGFALFKEKHPNSNAKLLLHTSWQEGWDIPRLIKEKKINNRDILTTYYCSRCKQYEVKPYAGEKLQCRFCNSKDTLNTTSVGQGVSDSQLNEIYNMLDVYCHPFTSGGQEIPTQEAKLCELITLVTNYSCGEDVCNEESGGLPLEWAEYREPGTQFIKASTIPASICAQLSSVYLMSDKKIKKLGKKSREYVINNYSTKVIGANLEKIIDNMEVKNWDFDFSEKPRDPNYQPPHIESDSAWLVDIYYNILNMSVDPESDQGHKHWMSKIQEGMSREKILDYFKSVAKKENSSINKSDLETFLGDEGRDKRIAVVMPGSAGDVLWTNALIKNLKSLYPEHNIYFITNPKFFAFIEDNPYIHNIIPYNESMDNLLALEGNFNHPGYFDVAYLPHIGSQKILAYTHNGRDKIQFDIYDENFSGVS